LSKKSGPLPIGEKAVVTDADETARQYMSEETPYEIAGGQHEEGGAISAASIAVAESDSAIAETYEAFVPDGDAVRVAAEVTQHLSWSRHRCFAVDDPRCTGGFAQALAGERLGHTQGLGCDSRFETLEELSAKHPGEDSDG
jgi:hypothetical protein